MSSGNESSQTSKFVLSNLESPNNAFRAAPGKQLKEGRRGHFHEYKQGNIVGASAAPLDAESRGRKLLEREASLILRRLQEKTPTPAQTGLEMIPLKILLRRLWPCRLLKGFISTTLRKDGIYPRNTLGPRGGDQTTDEDSSQL
ncbi:hypothetical protein RUND412_006589 [Rhizina undulata]